FDGPPPRPAKAGPAPRQNRPAWMGAPGGGDPAGSRPPRPPRDQRGDRDPWGAPRLPGDRSQGSGPRPQQGQPGTGSRPQQGQSGTGSRPQQGQPGTGSRPQQGQPGTGPRPQANGQGRPAPQPRERPSRPS